MNGFRPRAGQMDALSYSGGKLGIAAVPGSGKTRTLAELAARLVAEQIADREEVLVVTLVNSAVDNLKSRINASIGERGLLPGFGYRVRTLHGLAHDIVRERPGLVGLSEDFGIIDEREANLVLDDAVQAWSRTHPSAAEAFLAPDLDGKQAEWVKRARWPSLVHDIVSAFIKRAKDLQLTPEVLLAATASLVTPPGATIPPVEQRGSFSLGCMSAEIYSDYQRSLAYRGAVDFDDLIRLALEALHRDPDYLARLQDRWPYILEDEAQDSSETQEAILRLLAARRGNWVRVGDPNQAIYETFTNADPRFLRRYLDEPDVTKITLDESGRSQQAIIDLANYLVAWAIDDHPRGVGRGAFLRQYIRPTAPGDAQPNPPAEDKAVHLIDRDLSPEQELEAVADSLQRWLADHEDMSVAVLAPRNQRGFELIDLLKVREVRYVELLRSTSLTRLTAGALGNVLRCLADPASARKLALAFAVWRRDERSEAEANGLSAAVAKRIRGCAHVESYLWPRAFHDWLAGLAGEVASQEVSLLAEFREVARRWHRATMLPIDQLILTLAGDLFRKPAELALAHKLAVLLRDVAEAHASYRLVELVEELAVIARNERRFLGFTSEETGFEPPAGQVTVATMHKSKGLEWDRVYLMSLNNYDFPSGLDHDTYIGEKWFIRDKLNLEAEALAQLDSLAGVSSTTVSETLLGTVSVDLSEGMATHQARLDYVAERLRLLYVGITRAKRDLIVTWNKGRRPDQKLTQAVPFLALLTYWQTRASQGPPTRAGDSELVAAQE